MQHHSSIDTWWGMSSGVNLYMPQVIIPINKTPNHRDRQGRFCLGTQITCMISRPEWQPKSKLQYQQIIHIAYWYHQMWSPLLWHPNGIHERGFQTHIDAPHAQHPCKNLHSWFKLFHWEGFGGPLLENLLTLIPVMNTSWCHWAWALRQTSK